MTGVQTCALPIFEDILDVPGDVLSATGADHAGFPPQPVLNPADELVLNAPGGPRRMPIGMLRGLFAAGGNIAVLLFSPRTALIWRRLVERDGLAQAAARAWHCCLSDNVARVLPGNWNARVTNSPDETAMLSLLEQLPAKQ